MAKAAQSSGGSGRDGKTSCPGSPVPPPSGQRTSARKFVRESWGELKKVQWPTRQQVAQGTLVVGVVTIAIATYVNVIDVIAIRVVKQLTEFLT